MIKAAIARTPILVLILMFMAVGYTIAHNKVVVVPLGADAGVSGLEVVENLVGVNPNTNNTAFIEVDCPSGKKATGGGVSAFSPAHVLQISSPASNLTGWMGGITLNVGSTRAPNFAIVYAICADTIN